MQTVSGLVLLGTQKLKSSNQSGTASLDASLILAYVLNTTRENLILEHNKSIDEKTAHFFFDLIERRINGEPVAYITQKKSFWLHDFFVTPDVLIPKPDTELLVEKAIETIGNMSPKNQQSLHFADICTGSGCVGISILAHFLQTNTDSQKKINFEEKPCFSKCLFSDISQKALEVAKKNAQVILGIDYCKKIVFDLGDLLKAPYIKSLGNDFFDIIVSNPPYVPAQTAHELLLDGRNEPILALSGGKNGLDIITELIAQSFCALKKNGFLLLETGEYNAEQTRILLQKTGFFNIQTYADLAGMPRVTVAQKS